MESDNSNGDSQNESFEDEELTLEDENEIFLEVIEQLAPKTQGTFESVPVKEERPDEAEIRELAAKMVEANKAKMQATTAAAAAAANSSQRSSLPGILGYLNRKTNDTSNGIIGGNSGGSGGKSSDGKIPLDDESQRGRFGWISFDKIHIPYIFRGSEKYCAVRILEMKLLNKYLNYLHSDIYSCTCIKSYFITEAESKLFNEINLKHCENQFGKEQFTCKDLVVRLTDAKEFYSFLDVCYTKLTIQSVNSGQKSDRCGFIRINKESVVPYTVKDNLKYVPLFYFEGEVDNLKLKAEELEGWDLSYLKFCCKVQGIRNELFASETCPVISLSDIKNYFPPGTGFEDYWPSKMMDSQLFISGKSGASAGGWTKQPPAPPPTSSNSNSNNNNNKNTNNINNNSNSNSNSNSKSSLTIQLDNSSKISSQLNSRTIQNIVSRNSTANSSMAVNQQRSVSTTHPAHSSPNAASSGRTSTSSQPMLSPLSPTINGWNGLVGGQQTFQTTIVPQPNPVIRMQNTTLNIPNSLNASKAYSNQQQQQQQQQTQSRTRSGSSNPGQYPVYPVTTMPTLGQAQPPPLVRSTSHSSQPTLGYPTYGKDDWIGSTYTTSSLGVPSAVSASTYPQMLTNLSSEQVQALLHPPATASALLSHSQRHTPPAHNAHNASHPRHAYPPPLIPVNGTANATRDARGRKPLIPISEAQGTSNIQPYGVQKALVAEKLVPCINFKPYIYSELLMTLPDFLTHFFPTCDINHCRQVLTDVLCVDLYQGNRLQMKKLMEAGKCSSLTEDLPLIQVRSIMKYMPQMKYMFRNTTPAPAHSSEEHPSKKRQRTS